MMFLNWKIYKKHYLLLKTFEISVISYKRTFANKQLLFIITNTIYVFPA